MFRLVVSLGLVYTFFEHDTILPCFAYVIRLQSEFNPALRLGAARYSNVSLIKDYLVITNLRVQFSRLVLEGLTVSDAQTFSRDSPNANEFFYGVYDWHVAATCHCFGHADSCAMLPGDSPMVSMSVLHDRHALHQLL